MQRGGGISRQQQAFEALLEPDDDIVDGPATGAVQLQDCVVSPSGELKP